MNTRLNAIFLGIKYRCCNPKDKRYKIYGGRGISVCDEWRNSEMFDGRSTKGWIAFKEWALKNGYNDTLTIDRIDNKKGYSPENCRWVTYKVQENNRTNNHLITYNGQTKTLAEWCDELKLNRQTMTSRIVTMKWPIKKAFEKEIKKINIIFYKGKGQSLNAWCKELSLDYAMVFARINKLHWSIEKAFETKRRGIK